MARVPRVPRKPKAKVPVEAAVEPPAPIADAVAETAVAAPVADEPAAPEPAPELQPPSTPVEPVMDEPKTEERRGYQRDKIAASLNIAKLQAMSMTELNGMARELGVENFGTMRKHEVIFHILQKNAERAGVLF